jgi:transposase
LAIANFKKTNYMKLVEKAFGKPVEELLRELYLDKGMTLAEIANEIFVSEITVLLWMRKFDVPTRKMTLV